MNLFRHVRLGFASSFLLLAACTPPGEGGTIAQSGAENTGKTTQALAFDFETGNVATEVIIPNIVNTSLQNFGGSGGDASLILYTTTMVTNAWFDAVAPYRPVVKGVYSNLPKRPASESATNRNKNTAMLYAALRTLSVTMPERNIPVWRGMLQQLGLNPDDNSSDLSTPAGIGNTAGNAVIAARRNDGMNVFGDAGGRKYNRKPYADTTNFEPVNTAYDLVNPSKWQPLVKTNGSGIFTVQQYVTPQYGQTRPYTHDNGLRWRVPPPVESDWQNNRAAYKKQVDDILEISANLTDHQKMVAELFNNKFLSLGFNALFVTISRGLTLDQFVDLDYLLNVAAFDGGIAVWKEKTRHNAVRPMTAVRAVYGDRTVRAWGGPGKGTVNDIKASEWESYLPTADHPEYPSGSSCFCAAHAQAARRYLGSDDLGWNVPAPKGSSVIEPGVTPATDITLSFSTWTQFAEECKMSRRWGGVHFRASSDESAELCQPIGDLAYKFVQSHLDGTGE